MYANMGEIKDHSCENNLSMEVSEIKEQSPCEFPEERPSTAAQSESVGAPSRDKSMSDKYNGVELIAEPEKEKMLTRPFLLASWVKLRAYQHIGLNWLVSIQTRRLNGILADESENFLSFVCILHLTKVCPPASFLFMFNLIFEWQWDWARLCRPYPC